MPCLALSPLPGLPPHESRRTIRPPQPFAIVLGTIAWGLGSGLGWPIAIAAAADRRETAIRGVAAVSALGYASMLIGPMAFGFLGEHIGWNVLVSLLLVLAGIFVSRFAPRKAPQ